MGEAKRKALKIAEMNARCRTVFDELGVRKGVRDAIENAECLELALAVIEVLGIQRADDVRLALEDLAFGQPDEKSTFEANQGCPVTSEALARGVFEIDRRAGRGSVNSAFVKAIREVGRFASERGERIELPSLYLTMTLIQGMTSIGCDPDDVIVRFRGSEIDFTGPFLMRT